MFKKLTALFLCLLTITMPIMTMAVEESAVEHSSEATVEPIVTEGSGQVSSDTEANPQQAVQPEQSQEQAPTENPEPVGEQTPATTETPSEDTEKNNGEAHETIPATGIELDPAVIQMVLNETRAVKALLTPDGSTDAIVWTSSDPEVLEITNDGNDGVITAKALGEALIIATAASGVTAEALVVIGEPLEEEGALEVPLGLDPQISPAMAGISIDNETATIAINEDTLLYAYPSNGNGPVTWTSSDPGKVEVTDQTNDNIYYSFCTIKGKATGQATITATANDGASATCVVTVVPLATGITVSQSPLKVRVSREASFPVSFSPAGTTGTIYTDNSNYDVVSAYCSDGNLILSGHKLGTATITLYLAAKPEVSTTIEVQVVDENLNPATSITLEKWFGYEGLGVGEEGVLHVGFDPENATDKITWKSSDETVIKVTPDDEESYYKDRHATATALKAGTATVTATTEGKKSASVTVKVFPKATSITLSPTPFKVRVGKSEQLQVTLAPAGAGGGYYATSSDTSVADTVNYWDGTVFVEGYKVGTATITVRMDGDNSVFSTIQVQVVNENLNPAAGIQLEYYFSPGRLSIGNKETIYANLLPELATDKITWTSSDASVVKVESDDEEGYYGDEKATLSALKEGTATITAKTEGGKSASLTVTVVPGPTHIHFPFNTYTMRTGEWKYFGNECAFTPSSRFFSPVWSSSNTAVAWVDEDGSIEALSAGTATITAKSPKDASIQASFTLNVKATNTNPAQILRLHYGSPLTITEGQEYYCSIEKLPVDATDNRVTYTSSDTSVFTISGSQGADYVYVLGVAPGTATLTVTAEGGAKATCQVRVLPEAAATGISLAFTTLTMRKDNDFRLGCTLTPVDSNTWVRWISSDPSVVSASDWNGETALLRAVGTGTATITAYSNDTPAVKATCTVTVVTNNPKPATSISMGYVPTIMVVGTENWFLPEMLPVNNTDILTVTSSNTAVAKVYAERGNQFSIEAIKAGTATITAKTESGKTTTATITVIPEATSISFSQSTIEVRKGKEADLYDFLKCTPSTSGIGDVLFTSSNLSVASGGQTVTGAGVGTVTITARLLNQPAVTATCTVKVVDTNTIPVTSLKAPATLSIPVGDYGFVVADVTPYHNTDTLTWRSDNESVVRIDWVSSQGDYVDMKGLKAGTANIVVTAVDSKKSATIKVTVGGSVPPVGITKITLNQTNVTYSPGGTLSLTATVTPSTNTEALTWSASDPNVTIEATNNGRSATVRVGADIQADTATVTVSSSNGVTASCEIKVRRVATAMTLDKDTVTLETGGAKETYQLIATLTPAGANDKVTWGSSKPAVARVDAATGLVTAVAPGIATITATTEAGLTATCAVTVINPGETIGVTLNRSSAEVVKGKTLQLTATSTPAGADVTWTTDNPAAAIVSAKGVVSAKETGSATITATYGIYKATCVVTVIAPATAIKVAPATLRMKKGDVYTVDVTLAPVNTTDEIIWSGSGNVVSVENLGTITAKNVGTATITATTTSGKSAKLTVTVWDEVASVSLDKNTITLAKGATAKLTGTPAKDNVNNATFSWVSDDTKIATVDANGTVKGIAPGETTIRYIVGAKEATCNVKVELNATGVKITPTGSTSLRANGGTVQLAATLSPANCTEKVTNWVSSDTAVATVNNDGLVTAKAVGTAKISATIQNGKQATCLITVVAVAGTPTFTISTPVAASTEVIQGKTLQMKGTVTGAANSAESASLSKLWSTSDPAVATVSDNGQVKGVGLGTAEITFGTATSSVQRTVKVTAPATSVKLSLKTLVMERDDTEQLSATLAPVGTDSTITWTSSNSEVVDITATGVISAKMMGTAIITATTSSGKKATCSVTVWDGATITSPKGNSSSNYYKLEKGKTVQLKGSVTKYDMYWKSSNETIATVDAKGKVKAVGAGSVNIEYWSKNGKNPAAVFYLDVTVSATIVQLGKTTLTLDLSYSALTTELLTAHVGPEISTSKVKWISNKPAVAAVDSATGEVTAVGVGTATITATTENGKKATCKVTVIRSATSLTIRQESSAQEIVSVTISKGKTLKVLADILPDTGCTETVKWSTSNSKIASVSANKLTCTLKGAGVGTAIITAQIGTQIKTFAVTVVP